MSLQQIYSNWQNNDLDTLRWLRIAYEVSDYNDDDEHDPSDTCEKIKSFIPSACYCPLPIHQMTMSQLIDSIVGIQYCFFYCTSPERDTNWVQPFLPVIESLRKRAYFLSTWNLSPDIIDQIEYQSAAFGETNEGALPSEEDYFSDEENRKNASVRLQLKKKILEARQSMPGFPLLTRIVCASFGFSTVMLYSFKDFDDSIANLSELISYDEYPFPDCDLSKLRKFLCSSFKESPAQKIQEMAKSWKNKTTIMQSFKTSAMVRTRQPNMSINDTMTFNFTFNDPNDKIPESISQMMKINNHLYSDCLLNSYSKQCNMTGDFIESLIRPVGCGIRLEYIPITGTWLVQEGNMKIICPSMCHAFYLIRKKMTQEGVSSKVRNHQQENKNIEKFNLPEIVEFDVIDEHLFIV